jgi:hypothetical protein
MTQSPLPLHACKGLHQTRLACHCMHDRLSCG